MIAKHTANGPIMPRDLFTARFSIVDEFSEFYHRHGYLLFSDLFLPGEIQAIYNDVLEIFRNRFGGRDLQETIVDPYTSQRDVWRTCAKQLQNSLLQLHAGTKPEIIQVLKKLGLQSPAAWVLPEVRIDMPLDQRYMQPWHQDWRSGQGSFNSVTIWTPLHDVTKDNGAIKLIPGSHLWGYLDVDVIQDPVRYVMKDPPRKDEPNIVAELKQGECILFSQMMVHASGINVSGKPRFTCQFRFADRLDTDFIKNNYRIPEATDLVWEKGPTYADMARVHGIDVAEAKPGRSRTLPK